MIFLLMQIAMSSPDMPAKIGVANPWTEYVKFVPAETSLPTFWTVQHALVGPRERLLVN